MGRLVAVLACLIACGQSTHGTGDDGGAHIDTGMYCAPPPNPAGAAVELAAPFATVYTAYDLGPPPGIPDPLGGTVMSSADPNTLLVGGGSERDFGMVYALGVTRDACNHIIGFSGPATVVAAAPYVDANLIYLGNDLMLYTEWPQYTLSQLAAGATSPSRRTDLRTLGLPSLGDQGPGGIGRVPPNLPAAGELRIVTWPGGGWYHVAVTPDQGLVTIASITHTVTVPDEPGGFAYVPAGSPGFDRQSLIVAEWIGGDPSSDRVAVYETDDAGDPVVGTRREFFHKFPRPWGAYFEPLTGDYLFLSWGTGEDHIYIVQGFVPPVLL